MYQVLNYSNEVHDMFGLVGSVLCLRTLVYHVQSQFCLESAYAHRYFADCSCCAVVPLHLVSSVNVTTVILILLTTAFVGA